MKLVLTFFLIALCLSACDNPKNDQDQTGDILPIEGTWQLISGTIVENGDTSVTDYTKNQSMVKIINDTHFSFLSHDLNKGKDSVAVFAAGGGRYTLSGDQYTEHLEYCSYREWEGNDFPFTVTIQGDTLTQRGVEKVENLGVERLNIEKYKKVASDL